MVISKVVLLILDVISSDFQMVISIVVLLASKLVCFACHGWVAINVNSMAGEPKLCLLCLSHGWIAINVNCMAVSWLDSH